MHPRKAEALKAQAMQSQAATLCSIDERLTRLEKKVDLLLKVATGNPNPKPVKEVEKAKKAEKETSDGKPDVEAPDSDPEKQPEIPPADGKPAE